MPYATVVQEMLNRFPALSDECHAYMDQPEPLPYVAIGCVLIPWLEACLEALNIEEIAKICDFIESLADEGKSDSRLDELIGIEIGERIPELRERKLLLSQLGPNTQRACRHHIDRLND